MPQVLLALVKSLHSFARPGLWRYLVLPPLVAGVLWLVAAVLWLGALIDWLGAETPLSWLASTLASWHLGWVATVLAFVGAWMILLTGAYLVAVMIAGVWALPAMVAQLAATDYADVTPRGRDSLLLAVGVTARATALYLLGWLLTLPVWIIPGMAVVHSFFWLAYLNRATFAFDALAVHASADEWQRLKTQHGGRFWLLGLIAAGLGHLPLIGLFAPALAAMSFVHYGFEALRAERRGPADGAIEGEVIEVIRD
jgi:uncharacterized protein involved in cysteine biosynthesis